MARKARTVTIFAVSALQVVTLLLSLPLDEYIHEVLPHVEQHRLIRAARVDFESLLRTSISVELIIVIIARVKTGRAHIAHSFMFALSLRQLVRNDTKVGSLWNILVGHRYLERAVVLH